MCKYCEEVVLHKGGQKQWTKYYRRRYDAWPNTLLKQDYEGSWELVVEKGPDVPCIRFCPWCGRQLTNSPAGLTLEERVELLEKKMEEKNNEQGRN